MSTPAFDAAVEGVGRAMHDRAHGPNCSMNPVDVDHWNKLARAALQASGWEEAAEVVRVASRIEYVADDQ